jgi:hypothetical protein
VVAPFVADLQLPISNPRIESYRPPNGSDLDMVTRYYWDIELSRALMPSIHAVELSLRNSIHTAITALHNGNDMWFYEPGLLEPGQLSQLATALSEIARRKAQATSGRIVAEVMFGFWIAMLTNPYEQKIWQPNGFAMLRTVFPYAKGKSIKDINMRYNNIRKLRNRVSHHEAVWDRPNLFQEHADIQEAIGWISPTLQKVNTHFDRFPRVYNQGSGYQTIEAELKKHLGIP